jgi:phosphate/sulfate permease
METIYLTLVIFLLGLAVFDLVVGVSNDAVNFMSSAVGSNAARFSRIMAVASIGIMIGAASSGGMMEIAKTGVFMPDKFTFREVIYIYLCVMLADILLLDFFNSLRLPTSTTISIVFELLGASIAVTFLRMYREGVPLSGFTEYINSSKALQMIVAIFVSVAVAFIVGWLIQFLLRAFTTFNYRKHAGVSGAVFGGISVAIVLNFIVNVGLKTSPVRESPLVMLMLEHPVALAVFVAAGVAALFFFLNRTRSFDPFHFITLLGTFALAMAFASNDLVNFIGVPVASYDALVIWRESGVPADEFKMAAFLDGGAPANSLLLILAGIIMVATLWLSKKSRNVIQTSVNLSRQRDGVERFSGNPASRSVVLGISNLASSVVRKAPRGLARWFERRYAIQPPLVLNGREPAAFDFVRASSNLMVAALLISLGTTFKLPLSTTYVSFMVLMGTSLADRAWNRDSAVYRVSGVFTVISGWFMTAIAALTLSALFATITINLGLAGVAIVFVFVMVAMFLANRLTDSSIQLQHTVELPEGWFTKTPRELSPFLGQRAREAADVYSEAIARLVKAVEQEDRRVAHELKKRVNTQQEIAQAYTSQLNEYLKALPTHNVPSGKILLEFFYLQTLLLNQAEHMISIGTTHILNLHKPLESEQVSRLDRMVEDMRRFCQVLPSTLGREKPEAELKRLRAELNDSIYRQVEGLVQDKYNYKNSLLYFNLLLRNLESAEILLRMDEMAEASSSLEEASQSNRIVSTGPSASAASSSLATLPILNNDS